MSFKDDNIHSRLGGVAGEIAEQEAERRMEAIGRPIYRFGTRKIPTDLAMPASWPLVIRATPDYIGLGCFYEVQGCGQSNVIHFKKEKLEALAFWHQLMPVRFLIYVQPSDEMWGCDLKAVHTMINHESTELSTFQTGRERAKKVALVPVEVLKTLQVQDVFGSERKIRKESWEGREERLQALTVTHNPSPDSPWVDPDRRWV